jgi:hypothetical protein
MASSRKKLTIVLIAIGAVVVIPCVIWRAVVEERMERRAVMAVSTAYLHCPEAQIEIGGGDCTDSGCDYEVRGCGASGEVSCVTVAPRAGQGSSVLGPSTAYDCGFFPALPGGGHSDVGYGFSNGVRTEVRRE